MRRRLLPAVVVLAALPLSTACSSSGSAGVSAPSVPSATSTDTSSPMDTSTPTPTPSQAVATAGTPSNSGSPDLPACMIGKWSAPLNREFGHLGVNKQSDGEINSGTGTLLLAFAADHTFSYTFSNVVLDITGGEAKVSGPVRGTWRLAGNNLTTKVTSSAVKTQVTVAGLDVGENFDDEIRSLTPNGATVTCIGTGKLELLLSGSQGGGAVMFDKA